MTMCVRCDQLVRLGVFVIEGEPASGMLCWPCVIKEAEE